MDKDELLTLLKNQLDTLQYFTPYMQIIPGVQEPDCTKLFQAQIDLSAAISAIEEQANA